MDSLTIYRIKDYPAKIYALFQLDEVAIKLNKGVILTIMVIASVFFCVDDIK